MEVKNGGRVGCEILQVAKFCNSAIFLQWPIFLQLVDPISF